MLKWMIVLALAVVGGCAATVRAPQSTAEPAVIESSHVDPESGDLIALWMPMREGKLEPVLVPHPYAVYILWPRPEDHPEPADKRIFIFYDNVAKKSYQTTDYDAFLAVVARQPRGITLLQIETCTVARCHMPKEQWDRLEKVLAEGNRRWAVNPGYGDRTWVFCYCECRGDFIYPGDKH